MIKSIKSRLEGCSFIPKSQTVHVAEARVSRTRKTIWGRRGRAESFDESPNNRPVSRNGSISDFDDYQILERDTNQEATKAGTNSHQKVTDPSDFRPSLGTEIVDLYVGPERVHFQVHKEILCTKIQVFAKMFKSSFFESKSNSASFPEDDPKEFDRLITWVYSGDLPARMKHGFNSDGTKTRPYYFLYCLAAKYLITDLADLCMDQHRLYEQRFSCFPNSRGLDFTYNATPEGDPMRKYMSQMTAYRFLSKAEKSEALVKMIREVDNVDVAEEVMRIIQKNQFLDNPMGRSICAFHSHGKEVCYRKKHPFATVDDKKEGGK